MSKKSDNLKRELELAVVDVLEQDYDLDVRLASDAWNRRRRNVATLRFDYHWDPEPTRARVVVTIEGLEATTHLLQADFSSAESIERSAEDCEALALSVHTYLREGLEADVAAREASETGEIWRGEVRRWED